MRTAEPKEGREFHPLPKKKPGLANVFIALERAKAKALAYLEAKYLLKQAAISQSDKAKAWRSLEAKYLLKQAAINQSCLAALLFCCGFSGCGPAGFGYLAASAQG
jgi:hypothetical protein